MRTLLADMAWCVASFVVVTVVAYWLRQQGVDLPTLPEWVTGL
jgi:hypothetical protein